MRAFLLVVFFILAGCNESVESATSPNLTPEQVSLGFFSAIYVNRDVAEAKRFVDAPMQEVLGHYHIAASVQRHMLNLSMTDVELEIEEIDIDFFRKFTDDVTVKVKIKGLKGGQPWLDDRTVRLNKRGKNWVIVEIMTEKRAANG
ncbi:hypothetical protein SHAM105786_14750 [Shewanella amazonensis]|uniref:Lipoprotein n=1 Tax=Shewanella amazonensis (strain ATCC BAA-1098 / SB2B) TaxID=326297 RepID=A1S5P4_SHEAM|nr:hypothetical protein [Shewanella amazonensis]ABL99700.1 conserved hypothetical protein [Shewanella amazonensis SB2B]